MKQYKFIYVKADAKAIEELVNQHAAEGYTLDKVVPPAEVGGYFWFPTYIMVKEIPNAVPVKYT